MSSSDAHQDTAPFAVAGATGQQGGAVVEPLLAAGVRVRALVRDPAGDKARALAARGCEVVPADQEDRQSLTGALTGVRALFMMTTYAGPDGTAGEVRRGRALADAAAAAGVPRVVYSSVGGAERDTGVPHFESKRRIEEHLTTLLPATFVRPTFFMDNLAGQLPDRPAGEFVLRFPMRGDVTLQLVSVATIGRVAARLLLDPGALAGVRPGADAVEIAGDEGTPDRIAEVIGAYLGVPARFEALPPSALGDDEDRKAMFRWFQETPGYAADPAATRRLDPQAEDLPTWLRRR